MLELDLAELKEADNLMYKRARDKCRDLLDGITKCRPIIIISDLVECSEKHMIGIWTCKPIFRRVTKCTQQYSTIKDQVAAQLEILKRKESEDEMAVLLKRCTTSYSTRF